MSDSPTVLIVEDDLSTQSLLVAVARHAGLSARAVGDGRTALAMIREDVPQAIILDLLLPEIDGFEVLSQLRRTSPELLGRTIVTTAATIRDLAECPELKLVKTFLPKPLDIDQLSSCLIDCARSARITGRDGAYEAPSQP